MDESSGLLTINDAAGRLGVSRDWVARQIRVGRLPVYELGTGRRRGRMLRLDPRDVAQLADTSTAGVER